MEQFNPNTLERTLVNPEQSDRQEALLRRGDSEALQGLEDLGDVEATRDVVSSLASRNPLFAENLGSLQNTIGTSFMREISGGSEIQNEGTEIQEDVIDYFSLDVQQIGELQGQLSEVGLDIFQLLVSLKEYIEIQLADLPEEYKEKIRNSIGRKTGNISELVTEMKEESTSGEDFKNKRWILDEKIGNAYNFYTTELFPTLEIKLALARGETIPERFSTPIRQAHTPNGTEYTTINEEFTPAHLYMEEIDELLNAPLDSDGNFDEGFFSTQNLLSSNNEVHNALFEEMNITKTENISLLSEEDKEIQQNAMIAYFILIGVQMVPYLGAPISLGVDGVDTFSSHDGTLELGKSLGMIDESFQMEKQWYDNALGGVGLALTAVGLQGIAKGKKLANSFSSLEKIGFGRIEEMLQIFGNKLGISQERLNGITEYLRSLFKGDIDEASNGGKVDEGVDGVETINNVSQEKFFQPELAGNNIDEKADTLISLAENTRGDYDNLMDNIGGNFNALEVRNSQVVPLKERSKIIDKANTDCDGDVEKITDVLRGSIVFDNLGDLRGALDAISDSDDISRVFIKNRLDFLPTNDILINVEHKNGFVSEIQLHIKEIIDAKEHGYILDKSIIDLDTLWSPRDLELVEGLKMGDYGGRDLASEITLPNSQTPVVGHDIYEIRRSIPENAPPELIRLREKLEHLDNELFSYARRLYENRTGEAFN